MEWFNTITSMMDTGLITSTIIVVFTSDVNLVVGIAFIGTSLLFFLCNNNYMKTFWNIYHKATKAQCNQAVSSKQYCSQYHFTGNVRWRYLVYWISEGIIRGRKIIQIWDWHQKPRVKWITKEQQEKLHLQGRKGKVNFCKKLLVLQVSRVSTSQKLWKNLPLMISITRLVVITIFNIFCVVCIINSRAYNLTSLLINRYSVFLNCICKSVVYMQLDAPSWYIHFSILPCSQSLFRHPLHILESFLKMTFLYLACI